MRASGARASGISDRSHCRIDLKQPVENADWNDPISGNWKHVLRLVLCLSHQAQFGRGRVKTRVIT
jgi:hypothetical protein